MAYSQAPGHTVPPSVPAGSVFPLEAARAQRVNQSQLLEERQGNGMSPAVLTNMTALLGQIEAQQTLPSMPVSIVAAASGYKRTMTCLNGMWDGYDLTHQFQDERSTAVYGPSNYTVFEQKASLRMLSCAPVQPAAPQFLQPAQMTIQPYHPQPPQFVSASTQVAPS